MLRCAQHLCAPRTRPFAALRVTPFSLTLTHMRDVPGIYACLCFMDNRGRACSYPGAFTGRFGLPFDQLRRPGRRCLNWRYLRRANTTTCLLRSQSPEYFVSSNRHLVNTYTNGIINGVCNCWHDRIERALPRFLATKRAFAVWDFNQDGFNFRRIESRGKLIVQQ